jgi:hypothetical protein
MNQLMNKDHFCIIMAGGIGSRFWPLSRTRKPKQFLDILGTGRTLLQQTFDRLRQVFPVENILIVTNEDYDDLVSKQLPEIKSSQILLEPLRRNTAPCIAFANHKIKLINPEGTGFPGCGPQGPRFRSFRRLHADAGHPAQQTGNRLWLYPDQRR